MEIIATPNFQREFKFLYKKHPSLTADLRNLQNALLENPTSGTPLGRDCFKIRLAIRSKSRGKSGGARVITCIQVLQDRIFLLSIYDKAEKADLQENELDDLLKQIWV